MRGSVPGRRFYGCTTGWGVRAPMTAPHPKPEGSET